MQDGHWGSVRSDSKLKCVNVPVYTHIKYVNGKKEKRLVHSALRTRLETTNEVFALHVCSWARWLCLEFDSEAEEMTKQ